MKSKEKPRLKTGAYLAYVTIRVCDFDTAIRCLSLFENNA